MRTGTRARLGLLLLALASAALVLGASVGAGTNRQRAAASIEGTWNYGSGQVLVTPTGGDTYVGTVTKTATFSAGCPHPVGEKVWRLKGGGVHYDGTHEGFGPNGCDNHVTFPASWDVTETSGAYAVKECVTITTDANRVDCQTLERAKPPAGTVRTRSVALHRAYAFFPRTTYDTKLTRSYRRAAGTVTVSRSPSAASCVVKVRGLRARVAYSIYVDASGARKGVVSTAGPWTRLGSFRTAAGGTGTFRCKTVPAAGSAVFVNQGSRATILVSGPLP